MERQRRPRQQCPDRARFFRVVRHSYREGGVGAYNGRGSVTILRHRVIEHTHTHRLDTHGLPTTAAVPSVLLVCTTSVGLPCLPVRLPASLASHTRTLAASSLPTAQLEVSSSPPPKARPARPRSCLLHACSFSRPSSAAFPLANLLPHPRSARLLLQPYQLRLSFHYTLIPAHVPAFPSSQPCAASRRCG